MRAPSRLGAIAATLTIALAAGAPAAHAELQRITTDDDDTITRTYGGGPDHLPVRPNLTWREAVAWAHTMPAVQAAEQTFAGRGYEAIATHDTAYISIDPPATIVLLPYRKPGLILPEYHYGQPMILIRTMLDREGFPSTIVTAGLLILDPVNEAVFTADSLTEYAESDASFDVELMAPAEGGPGERRYQPVWSGVQIKSRFNKWVRCVGIGSLGCLRTFFHVARSPALLVITFAEPEVVGIYFSVCEAVVATGCMIEFYAD